MDACQKPQIKSCLWHWFEDFKRSSCGLVFLHLSSKWLLRSSLFPFSNPFRQKMNSVKNVIWNESIFCEQGAKVKNVLVSYVVTQTIIKDMSQYKFTGKRKREKEKERTVVCLFSCLVNTPTRYILLSFCKPVSYSIIFG